jgi:hypothetical protein
MAANQYYFDSREKPCPDYRCHKHELPERTDAIGSPRFFFCRGKNGQKYRGKNCDDCDDDQQLNEGECLNYFMP